MFLRGGSTHRVRSVLAAIRPDAVILAKQHAVVDVTRGCCPFNRKCVRINSQYMLAVASLLLTIYHTYVFVLVFP